MKTRSMTRTMLSKKRIYRTRVKSSTCRGRKTNCYKQFRCKKTVSGKRNSYCRKIKNQRI
jgi:hypothetical protein